MIIKNCFICNIEFNIHAHRIDTARYCSHSCAAKGTKNFSGKKHSALSRLRMGEAQVKRFEKEKPWNKGTKGLTARNKTSFKKGDVRISGKNNPRYKNGKTIDHYGYIWIKAPVDWQTAVSGGRIREHRYIVEKDLGRYLTQAEEVHHINQNKQDNRIENLMVLSKREHAILHQELNRRQLTI
jgi:hypothetical protein